MKKSSSRFLLWSATFALAGFVVMGTSSCSKKYGCPAVEQTDINSKTQKSTSGLFGDDFGKPKKKKKNKKKKN